jgi:hypothetical protein
MWREKSGASRAVETQPAATLDLVRQLLHVRTNDRQQPVFFQKTCCDGASLLVGARTKMRISVLENRS